MRVSFVTEPGLSSRANEDFIAATPSAVVLLDGAGVPEGLETGCSHGVRWFAVELGTRLLAKLVTQTSESLADALARAIGDVRALHERDCDLDHPGTPAAAVALLRDSGDQVQYLVLADCTVVLETRGGIQAMTDDRIAQVATAERTERVARAEPSAAYQAITATVPSQHLGRALMMTDGATRLVDTFALATWDNVLEMLKDKGPEAVVLRV